MTDQPTTPTTPTIPTTPGSVIKGWITLQDGDQCVGIFMLSRRGEWEGYDLTPAHGAWWGVDNDMLDKFEVIFDAGKETASDDDSNLIKHAKRELALLGEDPEVVKGYLDMIRVFAAMGHSGGSASVFIPTLTALLSFQNLKPLTNDPDEWHYHGPDKWDGTEGVWQNTRNGEAFSRDGGKTYYLLADRDTVITSDESEVVD